MGKSGNIYDYIRSVRFTRSDGKIDSVCASFKNEDARSIVTRALGIYEMLDAINGLLVSLRQQRDLADYGNVDAKYNANIQIALIDDLRKKIGEMGGRTRYVSAGDMFELY